MAIKIPDFDPRSYQIPFLRAMDEGCQRAVLVWHRRAGKEIVCWNWLIKMAYWHRVGTYVYYFPTSRLGRRILWDGADKNGRRFIDYIPKELIDGVPNAQEMKIRLKNGSLIQIMGTDTILNVGINPIGCIFSEYSLQDPTAWSLTRPILRENGGWAVFNFTPRGKNHAYELYNMAKDNADWYCQKITVDDTGVVSAEDIQKERDEGMSEHLIRQEFYCSFEQGIEGSVYAKLLDKAELEGRITNVVYDTATVVNTYWDIGISDPSVVLFAQQCGNEVHLLDMYQNEGEGLQHYARVIQEKANENNWIYGSHFAPHDIQVRELGTGAQSRWQVARELGIHFDIVPNIPIIEGIELARNLWPKLWINKGKCKYFVKCAEHYHRAYNERLNVYTDKPVHDWSSHCMDCLRYMAISQNRANRSKMTERDAEDMQRLYQTRY